MISLSSAEFAQGVVKVNLLLLKTIQKWNRAPKYRENILNFVTEENIISFPSAEFAQIVVRSLFKTSHKWNHAIKLQREFW